VQGRTCAQAVQYERLAQGSSRTSPEKDACGRGITKVIPGPPHQKAEGFEQGEFDCGSQGAGQGEQAEERGQQQAEEGEGV